VRTVQDACPDARGFTSAEGQDPALVRLTLAQDPFFARPGEPRGHQASARRRCAAGAGGPPSALGAAQDPGILPGTPASSEVPDSGTSSTRRADFFFESLSGSRGESRSTGWSCRMSAPPPCLARAGLGDGCSTGPRVGALLLLVRRSFVRVRSGGSSASARQPCARPAWSDHDRGPRGADRSGAAARPTLVLIHGRTTRPEVRARGRPLATHRL